ncbi:MAG: hypothetical protein KGL63_04125 [Betaproteobacteria bacterium]|nr:hypothetical protein [Betaproteobacteria bacterium]
MNIRRILFLMVCGFLSLQALADEGHETPAGLQCKKTARKFFEKRWGEGMIPGDEEATAATYTNHINAKLGKCFILIEGKTTLIKKKMVSGHFLMLYDLSDGKEYGSYEEENKPKRLGKSQKSITCSVNGATCGSASEFEAMVKPFMED